MGFSFAIIASMSNKNIFLIGFALIIIGGLGWYGMGLVSPPSPATPGAPAVELTESNKPITNNMHTVTIKTNLGVIKFQTYDADAPKAVNSFVTLAGKNYFNGLTFHRVIKGFMIQGGDPNCTPGRGSGPCGAGGPGYTFEDELNLATESYKSGYRRGVVAMANAGTNTNVIQFFIMHADYPLPNNYTIFGKVIEGQDVVDAIANLPTGANDRPATPVVMEEVSGEVSG